MAKKSILVVDDDHIARMLILKVLQMRDYEAVAIEDGKKALEVLHDRNWDLLILDLELPGIKGLDLVKEAINLFPKLKIIILTAHGSLETAIEAIHYKVSDYLLKPALPRDILNSVDNALREEMEFKAAAKIPSVYTPAMAQSGPIQISRSLIYDSAKRRIREDDVIINLTQTENTIFAYLAEYQNKVVSHEELVEYAYGYKVTKTEAAKMLRPVICRIRNKFLLFRGQANVIQNVRGKGYLVELKVE